MAVVRRYFDAWNRHDAAAIVAGFHDDGTYRPAASATLTGDAIARHAADLFAAFADLTFDVVSETPARDGSLTVEWLMRGTSTGPFMGAPATGRVVSLPGIDALTVDAGRLRTVTTYFDRQMLAEQLGLQVAIQPYELESIRFGTCVHMAGAHTRRPGAFSLTSVHLRSQAEVAEADERGAAILEQLADAPGFISTTLTTIGLFGHTITAWDDADAPRRLMAGGAHKEAMTRFFGDDFAAGGWTSVWVPARRNGAWVRCPSCRSVINRERHSDGDTCRCGAPVPDTLPYW